MRVNEPPVAKAGPDQLVTASLVQFDGSASGDQDDSIAKYDWDFGDGGTGTGPKPTHVYTKPGTYTVRLTVTDASKTIRSSASDDTTIVVNAVPIADAGPDLIGAPGEGLVFSGARSVDPGRRDRRLPLGVRRRRDRAPARRSSTPSRSRAPTRSASRSRTIPSRMPPSTSPRPRSSSTSRRSPTPGPTCWPRPGQEVDLSAANSFDTDGEIASYRWDFSDQSEPADTARRQADLRRARASTPPSSPSPTTAAPTTPSPRDSVKIAINHAPVADAGPDIVSSGTTITFDGTRSVDADGDALAYSWDFGDGQTATGPVVTHTYAEGGTYPVVLLVNDGTRLANATGRVAISVKINRRAGRGRRQERAGLHRATPSSSTAAAPPIRKAACSAIPGPSATAPSSDIVNPTKSYNKGGTYPVTLTVQDNSGLPNGTSSSQIAVRVDQGPVAERRQGHPRLRQDRGRLRRLRLERHRRRGQQLRLGFRRRQFRRRRHAVHIYEKPGNYRVFLKIDGEKAGICQRHLERRGRGQDHRGAGGGDQGAGCGADHRYGRLRRRRPPT